MTSRLYSLSRSKTVLTKIYRIFIRKKKHLSKDLLEEGSLLISKLQEQILNSEKKEADYFAKKLEIFAETHLKKGTKDHIRDFTTAIIFALIIAIIVRQMWFEPYEIPTGSMRPTLKEKDRLLVSKTDFGINIPLKPAHFYFDPNLVKRNGILIFTGENMDIQDVDTYYFYLFPGKKQYIKRLIGKPGDTLYFYGGQIFGIDEKENDLSSELQLPSLHYIDHIPFIHFEGRTSTGDRLVQGIYTPVIIRQMNEPVAKLYVSHQNQLLGELIQQPNIDNFYDLWGFKNFAMARILTKDQVHTLTDQKPPLQEGTWYLELFHHPNLKQLKLQRDEIGRLKPTLGFQTTIIPLQESHLRKILKNMYTARFIVKNGFARRYGIDETKAQNNPFLPRFPDIPDGCYEFYEGKAYQVNWEGILKALPSSHPLYQFSFEKVQLLFNMGIEFDLRFSPQVKNQLLLPSRYSYFRNHALYLLGAPIFEESDEILKEFLKKEEEKQKTATSSSFYEPFIDNGPPFRADGSLNIDFIKRYGLKIPSKMYLVLGDNYAMSADSRYFGFVPEDNIRGAPHLIFWPPGSRFGLPNQPTYPLFTLPRLIIWGLVALTGTIWVTIHRRRNQLPLKL